MQKKLKTNALKTNITKIEKTHTDIKPTLLIIFRTDTYLHSWVVCTTTKYFYFIFVQSRCNTTNVGLFCCFVFHLNTQIYIILGLNQ